MGFIVRFVSVVTHFITARKDICRWFRAEMIVPWHMGHRIRGSLGFLWNVPYPRGT